MRAMLSNSDGAGLRKGLALAALGAVVMSACDADRENFISPIGDVILDFSIGLSPGDPPSAAGGIDEFLLVGFDPSGDNAFGTASGALGLYVTQTTDCCGDAMGFDLASGVRNSSQDPRLPALQASSAAAGSFFGLFNPAFTGVDVGWWDLFGQLTGLAPNTTYTIALARMSLTVNGELDHEEMLLTGAVTDPDELSFLGGAEAGSTTVVCNFSAGVGVDASRNPVALGSVTTNGAGEVTVDCLPVAINDSPWWRDTTSATPPGAADSVPVGVNALTADGGEVLPGQYNYVLLIEGLGIVGNPVPDVAPTVRIQIGPDIDASGAVIPKAFAPFPDGLASDADLLAGPGGIGQASAISFSAEGLAPITGVYQVWLLNDETGDVISPTGDITITNEDDMGMEVIVSQTTGNAFNTTDPSDVVTFVTDDATAGVQVGTFTHVFVSIEGAAAGTPSMAQPFFAQYTDMNGAPDDASMWTFEEAFDLAFGNFNSADEPYVFDFSGFGQGAFTGAEFGTADLFRARFRNIALPPGGYFYEGFLHRIEDGAVVAEVSTGDLTTEFAEGFASLRDVDIDTSISTQIGPSTIIESANRATLAEVGSPFETFDTFVLKLRPKLAESATEGTQALQGTLPETLKAREVSDE